jgi:hypothetical protein
MIINRSVDFFRGEKTGEYNEEKTETGPMVHKEKGPTFQEMSSLATHERTYACMHERWTIYVMDWARTLWS